MKIFVEIPARGGSKGVPGKALKDLCGKPVIAHTIEHALSIKGDTRVFVNTDDPEIRDAAIKYGAEVPFLRPSRMARDNSNLLKAVEFSRKWFQEHEKYRRDIYVIMSPTHPFRRKGLVNTALEKGMDNSRTYNIGSVSPANVCADSFWEFRNERFRPYVLPEIKDTNHSCFYQSAFSFNIVFEYRSGLQDLKVPFILNHAESVDIDEPRDLALARYIARSGNPFSVLESGGKTKGSLWGKELNVRGRINYPRILLQGDYPRVGDREKRKVSDLMEKHGKAVVTACRAPVHPYRLKYVDKEGHEAWLLDIPQEIRGNRHLYPEIYCFRPAIVGIPPGVDLMESLINRRITPFILDDELLLDRTIPLEGVLLKSAGFWRR